MPIDFSSLLNGEDEAEIHPRSVFLGLNRSPSFAFPRDIQTEVLNSWFEQRDNRDNVIKLNVGSGKTLVGLLILQSSLNENKGPALYLAPNKQLAQQVIREGNDLGLELTDDPSDPSYLSCEKICVANVYKVFNGKSVFGVNEQRLKIGSVVVDDAHSCISTITNQFQMSIENQHECFKRIFEILSEDLRNYNESKFYDIKDGDPNAYLEVPFWSWYDHNSEVLRVLRDYRKNEEFQFSYPLISEILQYCRCIIGGQYLEIEPHLPNLNVIKSFSLAERRIFLTAMFADDSVIFTHFGADQNVLNKPIVPTSSQSMGERMILMPQVLNPKLDLFYIQEMLRKIAKSENVVVIVPSGNVANDWKQFANNVLGKDTFQEGIRKLQSGQKLGLTVLVNRYDGIDLPGKACRVLVLAGLPEAISFADRIDDQILSASELNLKKQMERIEQGMGRGVRSNDDYCVVLLLGPKLVRMVTSPEGKKALTPATRAQLDLSQNMSKSLKNPNINEIQEVINQCLDRDEDWIRVSKRYLAKIETNEEFNVDESKLKLKRAFDKMLMNQPQEAVEILDSVINNLPDGQIKAWLYLKNATFLHFIDKSGAQKKLKMGHELEQSVTRPLHGVSYVRLSQDQFQQASNLINYHHDKFSDLTEMKLFVNQLCSDLRFISNTANKFESAVFELAKFIGIGSQRPELAFNEGPDNLWQFENSKYLVIECKNGVKEDQKIAKRSVGQLSQSVFWFNEKYLGEEPTPVLIHPSNELGKGASELPNMRVITDTKLKKLKDAIITLSDFLTNTSVSGNVDEVARELKQLNLVGESFESEYTVRVKSKTK